MDGLSIPPLIMAGITFYVGLYHVPLYLRQKEQRENLTFALSCLTMGLYDVFTAGLYNVTSPLDGVSWQRAQVVTLALVAITFAWFVYDYLKPTGVVPRSTRTILVGISAYFVFAAVTGALDRTGLYRPLDQPAVKDILFFGHHVTYYEMDPGPLSNVQSVAGLVGFAYLMWITVRVYRAGFRRETRPLLAAMILFYASAVNDTAVVLGVYPFVYTLEYAYLGMVLLMTYSLTRSVVEVASVKQALIESEARYQSLFENAVMGVYRSTPDGRWIMANPALLRMLGYSSFEELAACDIVADAHAAQYPRSDFVERMERDGRVVGFEAAWRRADGSLLSIRENSTAIRDRAGNMLYYEGTVEDIVEQKQAEAEREKAVAELMHRGTQLVTAAEVSASASTILDPEELMRQAVELIQQRFNIYYVGLFLVDQTGEHAVLRAGTGDAGQKMLEVGHRLAVGGRSMIGRCVAEGKAHIALDAGHEAVRFSNPLLPETRSEMALPLNTRGACIGALSVQSSQETAFSAGDITALQSMADQLAIAIANARLYEEVQQYAGRLEERVAERTAALDAVNKELEAFAYSVSHDLRAPLRSMDGFSQALLEDYGEQLDATAQDYLGRVRASSQHMGQLIDDLLKLSRLTRVEMQWDSVDLSALARSIATRLHQAEPERRVEFAIADGVAAAGDARLLRVMLENLLGNAWKFTAKQDCATIEFGCAEDEGEGRPVYFVRDNGAGFDMAYAGRLFGAFQRLHSAAEFEGTGVGLATVQRIVHRHGGRVWAEGVPNAGATFYFTLRTEGEDA